MSDMMSDNFDNRIPSNPSLHVSTSPTITAVEHAQSSLMYFISAVKKTWCTTCNSCMIKEPICIYRDVPIGVTLWVYNFYYYYYYNFCISTFKTCKHYKNLLGYGQLLESHAHATVNVTNCFFNLLW